ncbi:MAG: ABC transporter permease [Acidobacteriota bacterium]|nr:ABC transporter permease [Acidobacteriota bacterium]
MPQSQPSRSQKFFRILLRLFPFDFRGNYGGEMAGLFDEQHREVEQQGGRIGLLRLWTEAIWGILRTAPREHWDILRQDCLCAFRIMQNNRGFTAIAVLTLALGIGANTAIFSAVDAVLLRPLPYSQGQQLVFIREQARKVGVDDIQWSVPEIKDYRRQNDVLSALVEYHSMSFTLFGHGDPDRVKTGVVSWNYFDVLGVRPLLGRSFRPEDDRIGAPPVLLLSNEYWRAKFGADPNVVGQTFEMNDKVHTVIGVLPAIPQYPRDNDVYMPTSACPFRSSKEMIESRDGHMMEVFGRLKPGVTLGQAQADFSTIASRLESEYPKSYPANLGYAVAVAPLKQTLSHGAQPTLLALLAAAVFVLLIACANVANLTLSRMAKREREFAVRTALGAGRIRLLRQLLTESFLLALLGAAAGLLLAYVSLPLLTDFAARLSPRAREIRIDSGVLWFTLLVAFGSSIVFGSISALFSRVNLNAGLKEGATASGTGRSQNRVRSVLVVSQVAFSFVLLIGAGLMLRSLVKMLQVNPGFVSQRVLAMRINFNWSKYKTADRYPELGKKLVDRIETEPGVISAAVASSYPLQPELLSGGPSLNSFQIEGRPLGPGEAPPIADTVDVSPAFFRTLGIPLIRGREFQPSDDAKESKIAVINQAMQRRFWPDEDPLGKRVSFDDGKNWWRIVGVVGDVRDLGLDRKPALQAYVCLAQGGGVGTLLVRTAMDPAGMGDSLTRAVHEVDPTTAVSEVLTLDRARSESLSSPRTTASLLGLFAALALVIATAGIGGILALMVSQRVHEIGIRMALGAPPSEVLVMILRQGLLLASLGVAIGFGGALVLTGLVKSLVFEVTPTDPVTFVAVPLVFITAAVVASYVPARRAASIDPVVALRCE